MKYRFGIFILSMLQDLHSVFGLAEDINLLTNDVIFNVKQEECPLEETKQAEDRSGNLFLTPYIQGGKVDEARSLARVNLPGAAATAIDPAKAPLLMWLPGGPGATFLFTLFNEHGPFTVDKAMNLKIRKNYAWTLTHSIIYVDIPVGTGFSFTENDAGYARSDADTSRELYSALTQFYKMFPDYTARDLYIAGESYAGKFVPALTFKIHTENNKVNFFNPKIKINLKGFIIGNGFSEPYNMLHYGEVLYNLGLIDENEKRHFQQKERLIRKLIRQQKWSAALDEYDSLTIGNISPYPSKITNTTGFTYFFNLLISSNKSQPKLNYYADYVQQPNVRKDLHVGNQSFVGNNKNVELFLKNDYMKSVKQSIMKLLDATDESGGYLYRLFFYNGQLDLAVPYTAVEFMLRKLKWSGIVKYLVAKKTIWRDGGKEILGYARKSSNLVHLLVRDAGHTAPVDQPAVLFKMINTFTAGRPF